MKWSKGQLAAFPRYEGKLYAKIIDADASTRGRMVPRNLSVDAGDAVDEDEVARWWIARWLRMDDEAPEIRRHIGPRLRIRMMVWYRLMNVYEKRDARTGWDDLRITHVRPRDLA
jgi:hypothetical protein